MTSQTWLGGMLLEPWKEWPGNVSKFPHEFQVRFFDPEHPERGGQEAHQVSHEDLKDSLLSQAEEDLMGDDDEVLRWKRRTLKKCF